MFIAFPSPRGVQGYPTRRSAYVKYGRTTRFRPLAGFKVIQLGEAHREVGHDHLVSVPSRGSRLSNPRSRTTYTASSTSFRPLAGFKVIQLS